MKGRGGMGGEDEGNMEDSGEEGQRERTTKDRERT